MCEMFKVSVFFLFFGDFLKIARRSVIDIRLHIPSWDLSGSQVMGNSIVKNLRVSFGL